MRFHDWAQKGENHRAYFGQYSSPGNGMVFDFEMTRSGEVPVPGSPSR